MSLRTIAFVALLASSFAWSQNQNTAATTAGAKHDVAGGVGGKIQIPNRSATSLFQGQQGKQKTEIHFDPATGMVTLKLLVQDPSGYFIPNIRRENFAVYENGTLQKNATVEIEHAPVTLALLLELGGRYPGLNKSLCEEVARAGRQLLDEIGRDDKITIWKYADHPEKLADFSQGKDTLEQMFYTLQPPGASEANLYDALIAVAGAMRPVTERKAIILVSSGIDTFSKAKYEDALQAGRDSGTPVYVISLGPALQQALILLGPNSPASRLDWKRAETELQKIAQVSGGRFYSPGNTLDLSATYDDIMENLRVRYVITYKSTTNADLNTPRTVRVELVNPKSGGPLEIVDANGKPIHAHVTIQETYTPSASGGA
jgi:VWFA-related protein